MYTGQVPSTSVTVEGKPLYNGREPLNKREAANRQAEHIQQQHQQQLAQRAHQAGFSAVQSTTTTFSANPTPYGASLGSNTSVTVTHKDARGNEHSKLVGSVTTAPAPYYTMGQQTPVYAHPAAVVAPNYAANPQVNNGRAPAVYGKPVGLHKQ